jgi:hypothetical protein
MLARGGDDGKEQTGSRFTDDDSHWTIQSFEEVLSGLNKIGHYTIPVLLRAVKDASKINSLVHHLFCILKLHI